MKPDYETYLSQVDWLLLQTPIITGHLVPLPT